jgi:hypothetical protein
MCDEASRDSNFTLYTYTTNVLGGRGSFITHAFTDHYTSRVLFVDLIDTTASVRNPSCLLFVYV